jgi:hypothetical protein
MKVKVNNKIYDSNSEPIMLILNENDKDLITKMDKNATKYCSFPNNTPIKEIKKFMRIQDEK